MGRRRVIDRLLNKYFSRKNLEILDWGCGPGGNFPMLEEFGNVIGVDASAESIRSCREKGFTNVVHVDTLDDFQTDRKFDLITNYDVLEHMSDDEKYLEDLKKYLVPSGFVMVTVPAYQFLWSELDDVLGHVRRYSRKELEEKFQKAGFKILKSSYFISFLALPIIVFRYLGKLTGRTKTPKFTYVEFPKPINWFFKKLVFLEGWFLQYFNLPFGTSIILLAMVNNFGTVLRGRFELPWVSPLAPKASASAISPPQRPFTRGFRF